MEQKEILTIKQTIQEYLDPLGPKSAQQIAEGASIAMDSEGLTRLLEDMVAEGLLFKTKKERYALPHTLGILKGRLQGNARGFGFCIPESGGDDLFIPAESMGKNAIVLRCDGHGCTELLDAILKVFPLDTYVEKPVSLMEVMPGDTVETPIWDEYKEVIAKYDNRGADTVGGIERFAFYEEAKKAYAIIATSEKALYANVMLQKGVI